MAQRLLRLVRTVFVSAALLVGSAGGGAVCLAQEPGVVNTEPTEEDWHDDNSMAEFVRNIRAALYKTLRVVLGMGALASLVYVIYGVMGGKQEAAQKMLVWVLVLSLCFALLTVFGNLRGGSSGHVLSGGVFNGQFTMIRSVLQILLSMVCMVTMVVTTIHVIGGDQEGAKKLLKWIVVSSAGLALLSSL